MKLWLNRWIDYAKETKNLEHLETPALIVFAKNPIPGKVKTRIAKRTSDVYALTVYEVLLQMTLQTSQEFEGAVFIYYSDSISPVCPIKGAKTCLQTGNDLGERMLNAMKETLQCHSNVLLIGSDCPYLRPTDFRDALRGLQSNDLVLGPTGDGGFYLIGMTRKGLYKALENKLFNEVNWSTRSVFSKTLVNAGKMDLKTGRLRMLWDMDTLEDWMSFTSMAGRLTNR